MVETNKHNDWGNDILATFRGELKKGKEANPVPFGKERLTTKEARNKFVNMDESERKQFIEQHGQQEVLRMLRGE